MAKRANGEGSMFSYRNGYAAYVWVTTPAGESRKKWVYGKTREVVHEKYVRLLNEAKQRPISTSVPSVQQYLTYWLKEVIGPNREPNTYSHYELMSRLHIIPALGGKRLDRLTVRDVQAVLNKMPGACQCCAQGKDAKRIKNHTDPRKRQRCCAIGECCQDYPSRRTIQAARNTLRAARPSPRRSCRGTLPAWPSFLLRGNVAARRPRGLSKRHGVFWSTRGKTMIHSMPRGRSSWSWGCAKARFSGCAGAISTSGLRKSPLSGSCSVSVLSSSIRGARRRMAQLTYCHCPRSASLPYGSVRRSKRRPAGRAGRTGTRAISSSRPVQAARSSRATSTEPLTRGAQPAASR